MGLLTAHLGEWQMSRLVVQIPCLNEAEGLPAVLADIPRHIEGIDQVLVLVVDDGSRDGTGQVALEHGADRVVRHPRRRGLAAAFKTGLEHALAMGADFIVNTDGDNQYPGREIIRLLEPLLKGEADMAVGDRKPEKLAHFSPIKRRLQGLGTWAVEKMAGVPVRDATSGFRALTRELALNLNLVSDYTYTLESIIQAAHKQFAIAWVDIEVNPTQRASRLIRSIPSYLALSARTMVGVFTLYKPLKVFMTMGLVMGLVGVFLGLRYLWLRVILDVSEPHLASLILASICLVVGYLLVVIAFLADSLGMVRSVMEDVATRVKVLELGNSQPPGRGVVTGQKPSADDS
jgi:glycosyltransferase involved in cell wall biosynthesis